MGQEENEKIELLHILCISSENTIHLKKMLILIIEHLGMNKETYKILKAPLHGTRLHEKLQESIDNKLNRIKRSYLETEDKKIWEENELKKLISSLKVYEEMKTIIDDYTAK